MAVGGTISQSMTSPLSTMTTPPPPRTHWGLQLQEPGTMQRPQDSSYWKGSGGDGNRACPPSVRGTRAGCETQDKAQSHTSDLGATQEGTKMRSPVKWQGGLGRGWRKGVRWCGHSRHQPMGQSQNSWWWQKHGHMYRITAASTQHSAKESVVHH